MMTNERTRFPFTALAILTTVLLGACGGDSPSSPAPGPDPNLGRTAPLTVFHALSDAPGPVTFTVGDTTVIADTVSYAAPRRASAQIGSDVRLTAKSTAGQSIGATRTPIGDGRITWVIFTGLTFGNPPRELISVTTGRPAAPASRALVRMINVSPNAGAVDLRIDDAAGPKIATGLGFKQTGEFITVDTSASKLVITESQGGAVVRELPVDLTAGRLYSVIFYGSRLAPGSEFELRAQVVEEP